MSKLIKMSRYIPGFYQPDSNVYVRGLLNSWAGEDDQIVQAIQNAKEQIYVKTAKLQYLDALGSNVGVFRPAAVNLADDAFRQLIPSLSFNPKQVKPTIVKVLYAFFGADNPIVAINEINPGEIVIQIPSSVPSLRRDLKGAIHFHDYSGAITAIDNVLKTMTVDMNAKKNLKASELAAGAAIGQGLLSMPILDNSSGTTGVTLQFAASSDLSRFTVGANFVLTLKTYPGSFVHDKRKTFTLTKKRGVLGQTISIGQIIPTLTMQDSSGIPDGNGLICFNFGRGNQEDSIKYLGRPNNTTLLLDPSYIFTANHSIGEAVNVIVKPYIPPSTDGSDYGIYLVGVEAARILAQQIVESIVAAGTIVRWIVVEPKC